MKLLVGVVGIVTVLGAPTLAHAESILFTGSGPGAEGVTLNAAAMFDINGTTLTITLTNVGDSSGSGMDVPGNALTGLFFDLPDLFTLTPGSASITPGSMVQGGLCDVGTCNATTTNVGGEFGYYPGSLPGGADRGIASAGYLSGGQPNFNGPNLDDPAALNGVNFGIIAPITATNLFNPNGGMAQPLVQGSVQFTMTIAGDRQLTTADLGNVSFQYGTDLNEPWIPGLPGGGASGVPEPSTSLLMLSGLAVATRHAWRKRRAAASR